MKEFDGPIELQLIVHVTDGSNTGTVVSSLGRGSFVNVEDQRNAFMAICKRLPGEFRAMSKEEWWATLFPPKDCAECGNEPMPGGREFRR